MMKNKILKMLSIVTVSTVLIGISSHMIFAEKSVDAKKKRLEILQKEYSDKQRKIEAEIVSMPRNSEEDWRKIREAESKLKDMPMSPEADQLIRELSPPISEQPRLDIETRIFYSRDILVTKDYYKFLVPQENDPVLKAKYETASKIMEYKKNLLDQVEKDFKEGKGTFEEWNRRIDELMKIDPLQNG
jgi:hypothetical protein